MNSRIRLSTTAAVAVIGVLATGCFERALRPVNPCTRANVGETIRVESVDEVDLLFMVDNSNSMTEEQTSLGVELPRLINILSTGDRDGDGSQDFQPVRSMHVGVITSDMGAGGLDTPTCQGGTFGSMYGDDGVLLDRSRQTGCMASGWPRTFDFVRGTTDPTMFASDVSCVARTALGGCGFEQQLEAVLKALSPSLPTTWTAPGYVPPVFFNGTFGHADRENMGFIRENSALAIILVSDEEDCSWTDPELVNQRSTIYDPNLNLRCFNYPMVVHPVERYIRGIDGHSGLVNLRQNPNLLIFAAIVGVPVATVPDPLSIDYNRILTDPLMEEVVDPADMTRLRPSCDDAARGVAYPPRRIVRVAQGIEQSGGSATVQSICQASYAGALDAIIAKIADALGGACLPRPLNPDAEGFVGCQVFEVLPTTGPTTTCAALETQGRIDRGTITVNGTVHALCEVRQAGPAGFAAGEPGWFYETEALGIPGSTIARTARSASGSGSTSAP
jgi:hypothetical protein